ncbi:MAG: hypothetical protein JW749_02330 [Sedimentisphaerales bacterium]|nr:hypothetical protein [Sedimentisphaerales bacterium]
MIATCPHCQSGFYISPDLAGNVINCSKCKKQVRAPDRRARGLSSSEPPPDDGIPVAIIAETRAEVEERLKTETEAKRELEQRFQKEEQALAEIQAQLAKETEARRKAEQAALGLVEKLKDAGVKVSDSEIESIKGSAAAAQKKLQEAIEARTKAEQQATSESKAKTEAQEQLKQTLQAKTDLESTLSTETQARKKAEEAAQLDRQNIAALEAKLKVESEARLRAESLKGKDGEGLAQLEEKLLEAEAARAKFESQAKTESEFRAKMENQVKEEKELRLRLESQWKAEIMANRKIQSQLEADTKAKETAELQIEELQAQIKAIELAATSKKSGSKTRGLAALTFMFSLITAAAAGYIAYLSGYIINSNYDRPVQLPGFQQPVYLPINLVAITLAGFVSAWVLYLIERLILSSTRPSRPAKKQQIIAPQAEETVPFGEAKLWRSS